MLQMAFNPLWVEKMGFQSLKIVIKGKMSSSAVFLLGQCYLALEPSIFNIIVFF
jgi:hypothetical protein